MPAPITSEAAKRLWDQGERVVFVDARTAAAWGAATKRLPAAISVPADEIDKYVREIPRDALVVTYCTCPHEESSVQLARSLLDRGFSSVKYLKGGLEGWQQAGYPLVDKDIVDEASQESFPASDPPAFTPVSGALPTDLPLESPHDTHKHVH
jgi:rhodanese-related sulfurtransferase